MGLIIVAFFATSVGYGVAYGIAWLRYQYLLGDTYPDSDFGMEGQEGRFIRSMDSDRKRQALENDIRETASPAVVAARRRQDDGAWRVAYAWIVAVVSFGVIVNAANRFGMTDVVLVPLALLGACLLVASTEAAFRARRNTGITRIALALVALVGSPAVTISVILMLNSAGADGSR